MPIYQMSSFELDFSRRALLLDTNVLVAAFWPEDSKHNNAKEFIFEFWEGEFIVPISVVVETWGMLVGKRRGWEWGFELLTWLNNPGNVTLIPQHVDHASLVRDTARAMHIDCVDALLMYLADEVSEQCDLNPPIQIATYDTSDFVRCLLAYKFRIGLLNPDTLDVYPYE
jgi:predicted nucleic acid-binding protein